MRCGYSLCLRVRYQEISDRFYGICRRTATRWFFSGLNPPEICRMAQLNRTSHGAASGDALWESKLPRNYVCLLAVTTTRFEEGAEAAAVALEAKVSKIFIKGFSTDCRYMVGQLSPVIKNTSTNE